MTRRTVDVPCAWFATCPENADGVAMHPILDYVPICRKCADVADRPFVEAEFVCGQS